MHGAGRFEYRAKNYLREIKSSGKDSFIYLLRLCLAVFLRYHDAEKKLIAFCVCSLCHQKACQSYLCAKIGDLDAACSVVCKPLCYHTSDPGSIPRRDHTYRSSYILALLGQLNHFQHRIIPRLIPGHRRDARRQSCHYIATLACNQLITWHSYEARTFSMRILPNLSLFIQASMEMENRLIGKTLEGRIQFRLVIYGSTLLSLLVAAQACACTFSRQHITIFDKIMFCVLLA